MAIRLFDHNKQAYDAAEKMLRAEGRVVIIHPTGTGKSFIGFKYAEQHPNERVLWLTPSKYIAQTQVENLKKESGIELGNITFLTYQKLSMLADEEIREIECDVLIFDEYHRAGAEIWNRKVDCLIETHRVPRLGLSATNIRYLDNQRNMADELFGGNIASEITLGEAIARGILLPPTYVISVYAYQNELRKYEERVDRITNTGIRDKNQKELDRLRRALEKADGLETVFKKHMKNRHGKYIVFCANRESLDELLDKADDWFNGIDINKRVYKVYSDEPMAASDFKEFKADNSDHLRLLYCIDMLNEGVHVDDIDGVILFRPTVSPIIYKQQIGRALSASKTKDPIIFDVVNNFENLYSISSIQEEIELAVSYYRDLGESHKIVTDRFKIIDETMDCGRLFSSLERSLASTWDMYFYAAKAYYEANGDLLVPKSYVTEDGLSLGMWIQTQRRVKSGNVVGNLTSAQTERLDSIGMVWDNVTGLRWDNAFARAKEYYALNGNLDVPKSYVCDDGFRLGDWIANNRVWYSNGSKALSKERIARLESIGMMWSKINYVWESYYNEAVKYREENGNLDIPVGYVTETGKKLGAWLNRQKQIIKGNMQNGSVSDEQIERLKLLGLNTESKFELQWNRMYEEAARYYKEHGNLDVPAGYTTEAGALGKWVRRQKCNKKLSSAQKNKLNKIGMIWQKEDPWEYRYNLLKQYYESHGDIRLSQSYVVEGIWLGKWLYEQRKYKSDLSADKIDKLNSLGMQWSSPAESLWNKNYTKAVERYKKYGSLDADKDRFDTEEIALNRWLVRQRKKYHDGKLSHEHIELLDGLDMVWSRPVKMVQ